MSYNEKYLRKVEWKINDLQVKMQTVDEKHLPRFVVEIERLKIRRAELQDLIEHEKTPRRAVQHSDIPVATQGVVPCRVKGPVKIGDVLG
jgi:hypothetical protein